MSKGLIYEIDERRETVNKKIAGTLNSGALFEN